MINNMKSILTKQFTIMNGSTNAKCVYDTDDNGNMFHKIYFEKDIDNNNWATIGLHVTPNLLFRNYESLNQYVFNVSFDYEFDSPDNIRIYNGIKWATFNTDPNSNSGHFDQDMNFNFTKNYWRLSTQKHKEYIIIKNLKITIYENEYNDFNNKKKILILGGRLHMSKDFSINDDKLISVFVDNYSYYFQKYLINDYGYTTYLLSMGETESNQSHLDGLMDFDFCIEINQRGLHKKGIDFYNKLKPNIKYGIFNITDNNDDFGAYGPQEYIFYSIWKQYQINDKSFYIGWATNPDIFYPRLSNQSSQSLTKSPNELVILIDDKYCKYDTSEEIIAKCYDYMLNNDNVIIYRFGYSDKAFDFIDTYKGTNDRYIVLENRLPQYEKAHYHNISDIFIVSHCETLGFEVLESAMAGCYIISKNTYIKPDLLTDILHFNYDDISELELDFIKNQLDINTQRTKALKYTWQNSVKRINNTLLKFYDSPYNMS